MRLPGLPCPSCPGSARGTQGLSPDGPPRARCRPCREGRGRTVRREEPSAGHAPAGTPPIVTRALHARGLRATARVLPVSPPGYERTHQKAPTRPPGPQTGWQPRPPGSVAVERGRASPRPSALGRARPCAPHGPGGRVGGWTTAGPRLWGTPSAVGALGPPARCPRRGAGLRAPGGGRAAHGGAGQHAPDRPPAPPLAPPEHAVGTPDHRLGEDSAYARLGDGALHQSR